MQKRKSILYLIVYLFLGISLFNLVSSLFFGPENLLEIIYSFTVTSVSQKEKLLVFINDSVLFRLGILSAYNILLALSFLFFLPKSGVSPPEFKAQKTTTFNGFFKNISTKVWISFLLLFGVKLLVSVYLPLTTDELFNFNNYVSKGPLVSLAFGIGPNNHILQTFISSVFYALTGLSKFSIRAPELLLTAFFFLFFLKMYSARLGFISAFILLLILNFSIDFFWFSTISRGYATMFILAFMSLFSIKKYFNGSEKTLPGSYVLLNIAGICVLPTFVLLPMGIVITAFFLNLKLLPGLVKSLALVLALSFVFYEPVIVFSGSAFLFGNSWVNMGSTHFWPELMFFVKELISLSGFGFWLIGVLVHVYVLYHIKKSFVSVLYFSVLSIILLSALVFQYAPPFRVYFYLLAIIFFFYAENVSANHKKYLLLAGFAMVFVFYSNFRAQVWPVYKRYRDMDVIFENTFSGSVFTNSDLYFNKANYLRIIKNYPPVYYSPDRIRDTKYLILKTESSMEPPGLGYVLLDRNKEVRLYEKRDE